MIAVRRAGPLDTSDMARLLNQIIETGGTTALLRPVTAQDIAEWMQFDPARNAWHVAEDSTGRLVGFQWIEPNAALPSEAADIATFVQQGQTGLGIGSALFEATRDAARALGYAWINAKIRADNEGGLIYYQSRGFEDYGQVEDDAMPRRLKRYVL